MEGSWVNISTGILNTTISGTVYEDNQLAIYKLDKVLLPLGIFAPRPKTQAPTPTPVKPTKESSSSSTSLVDSPAAAVDASKAPNLSRNGITSIGRVLVFATKVSVECF